MQSQFTSQWYKAYNSASKRGKGKGGHALDKIEKVAQELSQTPRTGCESIVCDYCEDPFRLFRVLTWYGDFCSVVCDKSYRKGN